MSCVGAIKKCVNAYITSLQPKIFCPCGTLFCLKNKKTSGATTTPLLYFNNRPIQFLATEPMLQQAARRLAEFHATCEFPS